jgi:hypothetical protein
VEVHSIIKQELILFAISLVVLWTVLNGIRTGTMRMFRGRIVRRSEDGYLFWVLIGIHLAYGVPAAIIFCIYLCRQLFR